MKTLDEVIDTFEKACDLERRCEGCSGCLGQENGCPNDGAESIPDALFYLKEYREEIKNIRYFHDEYIALNNELADLKNNENPPLTWDELKTMEGKPVWIELLNHDIWEDPSHKVDSEWWVIGEVRKDDIILATYLDEMELFEDDLGEIWQAYRKERQNVQS